jgi:hypothetical protein
MCANCVCTVTAPKRRRKRKTRRNHISVSKAVHARLSKLADDRAMTLGALVEHRINAVLDLLGAP